MHAGTMPAQNILGHPYGGQIRHDALAIKRQTRSFDPSHLGSAGHAPKFIDVACLNINTDTLQTHFQANENGSSPGADFAKRSRQPL